MTPERNPVGGFMNQKKKDGKSAPIETEYPTIENAEKVVLIRKWKKGTTLIVGDSVLGGIRSVKVCIFPGATTHDMYDYLKPLLKENPDNIILHIDEREI